MDLVLLHFTGGAFLLYCCCLKISDFGIKILDLLAHFFFFFFRYNIPELAKHYKVYALDLLGFGWSEKALIEYDALVWRDQVVDFLKEIVKEPAILVGNR